MMIKLNQCKISGAIQIQLNAPLSVKEFEAHRLFKKLIKDHSFEWDYDSKLWEGCVEAIEDILTDLRHMNVVRAFIMTTPEQGLSYVGPDGKDMEFADWIAFVKEWDESKLSTSLADIPKASFEATSSSNESTPKKRKFDGPPRPAKAPVPASK